MATQKVEVTKVPPAIAKGAYPTGRAAKVATGAGKRAKAVKAAPVKAAKKGRKAKAEKVSRPRVLENGNVSLSDIARSIEMEPKTARSKARKSKDIRKLAQDGQWAFKPQDRKKVVSLLKA